MGFEYGPVLAPVLPVGDEFRGLMGDSGPGMGLLSAGCRHAQSLLIFLKMQGPGTVKCTRNRPPTPPVEKSTRGCV